MQEPTKVKSAVEAVRCLYLAQVLDKQGHCDAARRWRAKVLEWMGQRDGQHEAEAHAPTDPAYPLNGCHPAQGRDASPSGA